MERVGAPVTAVEGVAEGVHADHLTRGGHQGPAAPQGLPNIARHFIQRVLNPRLLIEKAIYDVASNIWQAVPLSPDATVLVCITCVTATAGAPVAVALEWSGYTANIVPHLPAPPPTSL